MRGTLSCPEPQYFEVRHHVDSPSGPSKQLCILCQTLPFNIKVLGAGVHAYGTHFLTAESAFAPSLLLS